MSSYQNLETRINVLEDKLDFVMTAIRLGKTSPILGGSPLVMTMKDIYTESRRVGLTLTDAPVPDSIPESSLTDPSTCERVPLP